MKRAYKLSPEIREQMLRNVFQACGSDPSTVSLETLISYSSYRKERFTALRICLCIFLLLFIMVPLLFFRGTLTLDAPSLSEQEELWHLRVSSLIPVLTVNAKVDEKTVPVTTLRNGIFQLRPESNGHLRISVTLINRQILSAETEITEVDTERPALIGTESVGGTLILHLTDEGSGIDFGTLQIIDVSSGDPVTYSSDPESGRIEIPYPEAQTELTVSDRSGNTLSLLLTAQ